MAIKTLNYTVTIDGATPGYERNAGMQYDHKKTQLQFELDTELYNTLIQKLTDGSLHYRFDCYDGEGKLHLGEIKSLEGRMLQPYELDYWVTKFGGKLKICLVITLSNSQSTTTEFYCETVVCLDNLPESDIDENQYKSMTTLSNQTAQHAEEVRTIKEQTQALHNELLGLKAMLENGEWVFDGDNAIDVDFIIESEFNENSNNALSNGTISKRLSQIDNKIKELSEDSSKELADDVIAKVKAELLLAAYPVGSYYWTSEYVNPEELFGGMWEQIKDVFLLAAGDEHGAGTTGGEAQHLLTEAEMPKHRHRFDPSANSGGLNFVVPTANTGLGNSSISPHGNDSNTGHWASQTWGTYFTGNSQAHNNMPPFVAAYCFKRIG